MSSARRWLLVWMGPLTLALAGCSGGEGGGGVGGSSMSITSTGTGTTTTTEPPPCAPRPFEPLATDARVIALAAGAESVTALISASDSLQTLEVGVSAAVLWPKDPDHVAFHGDLFPRTDGSVCAAFLEERAGGSLTPVHVSCNGNPPVSTQLTPIPSPSLDRIPIAGAEGIAPAVAHLFLASGDVLTEYTGDPSGWNDWGPLSAPISYPGDAVSFLSQPAACYVGPDQHVALVAGGVIGKPREQGNTAEDCRIATDGIALYVTADDRFAVTDAFAEVFATEPVAAIAGSSVDALAARDGRAFALASSAAGRTLVELTTGEALPLEIPRARPGSPRWWSTRPARWSSP